MCAKFAACIFVGIIITIIICTVAGLNVYGW